jgi:hypothetical protein
LSCAIERIILRAVPFDYYRRLGKGQKAIYRRSDATPRIELPAPEKLRPIADAIGVALRGDDRVEVEKLAMQIVAGACRQLKLPTPSVRVLDERPRYEGAELWGLYVREEDKRPVLMVWMRTAAHERPVAHRTFVRTLSHELGHHLDYELLGLEDSFHTKGFFQRESSLVRTLLPKSRKSDEAAQTVPEYVTRPQLTLPWET